MFLEPDPDEFELVVDGVYFFPSSSSSIFCISTCWDFDFEADEETVDQEVPELEELPTAAFFF